LKSVFDFVNFNKPGKGVSPDEKQNRFKLFFILFKDKFTKLLTLNIICFALFLPVIVFFIVLMSNFILTRLGYTYLPNLVQLILMAVSQIPSAGSVVLLALSALCFGPVNAGMAYVLRNIARREHTWPVRDLFLQAKKNFLQSLVAGILDLVITGSFVFSLQIAALGAPVWVLLITIVGFLIWTIMLPYIYIQMVTFKLGLFSIIKNALIYVPAGIKANLLMSAGMIIAGALSVIAPIPLLPLLSISTILFIKTYCAYGIIEKYTTVGNKSAYQD
jgi:uncharacterized membrane protein YesL